MTSQYYQDKPSVVDNISPGAGVVPFGDNIHFRCRHAFSLCIVTSEKLIWDILASTINVTENPPLKATSTN